MSLLERLLRFFGEIFGRKGDITKIRKWFNKIPKYDRCLPLIVINGKELTPNKILHEVENNTSIGREFKRKLEVGEFEEDEALDYKIAKKRLIKLHTDIPGVMSLTNENGDIMEISSQDFIKEIEKETELGKSFIETELFIMEKQRKGEEIV